MIWNSTPPFRKYCINQRYTHVENNFTNDVPFKMLISIFIELILLAARLFIFNPMCIESFYIIHTACTKLRCTLGQFKVFLVWNNDYLCKMMYVKNWVIKTWKNCKQCTSLYMWFSTAKISRRTKNVKRKKMLKKVALRQRLDCVIILLNDWPDIKRW